jgi:predicted nucleic acid-binding Zn ribbon protein
MGYGYECEKCGALFIVPQHMEQAKQPEKEVNE